MHERRPTFTLDPGHYLFVCSVFGEYVLRVDNIILKRRFLFFVFVFESTDGNAFRTKHEFHQNLSRTIPNLQIRIIVVNSLHKLAT